MGTNPKLHDILLEEAQTELETRAGINLLNSQRILNSKLRQPLKLVLSGSVITVRASSRQTLKAHASNDDVDNSSFLGTPPIGGVIPSSSESTLDVFDGSVTGSLDMSITSPSTQADYYRYVGIELRNDNTLYVVWGDEAATSGAAVPPVFSAEDSLACGYQLLQKNGSTGTWGFLDPDVTALTNLPLGTGGGGGGGGVGGDEVATNYSIWWKKVIASNKDAAAGKGGIKDFIGINETDTNALLNGSVKTVSLNYDASKTITVSTNAVVVSGAPGFTVSAGDIISQNGKHTKITVVTDQTNYTVDDGSVLTDAAACISQALHSEELMDIGTGDQKASAHFSDTIYDAIVDYRDSASEVVGTDADVAYSICTNATPATGANWSDAGTRPQDLIGYETEMLAPNPGVKMYVRFFANKSTGSGSVTLDEFRVGFGRVSYNPSSLVNDFSARYVLDTATWLISNCTVTTVGNKTRITPNFVWDAFRKVTGATRQLMVDVNNSRCYFSTEDGITNGIDDIYIVPVSGSEQTIEFSKDLTVGATEDVLIVGHMHDAGGVDVSVFSTRLGLIENRVVYKVVGDGDTVSGKNFTLPYTPKNNDMVDVYRGFNSLSLQDEVSSDESTGEYTLSGTSLALGTDLQESEKLVVKLWRLT